MIKAHPLSTRRQQKSPPTNIIHLIIRIQTPAIRPTIKRQNSLGSTIEGDVGLGVVDEPDVDVGGGVTV